MEATSVQILTIWNKDQVCNTTRLNLAGNRRFLAKGKSPTSRPKQPRQCGASATPATWISCLHGTPKPLITTALPRRDGRSFPHHPSPKVSKYHPSSSPFLILAGTSTSLTVGSIGPLKAPLKAPAARECMSRLLASKSTSWASVSCSPMPTAVKAIRCW